MKVTMAATTVFALAFLLALSLAMLLDQSWPVMVVAALPGAAAATVCVLGFALHLGILVFRVRRSLRGMEWHWDGEMMPSGWYGVLIAAGLCIQFGFGHLVFGFFFFNGLIAISFREEILHEWRELQ